MTNRMDRYNYSFFEKKSPKINNASNEDNSSTGIWKTKVAAVSYSEFPHNGKNATPHSAKKEHAQALDKECKRMTVLYPFLSKSQIRSKAKESLSNVSKTAPGKQRRLPTTSKGKATLNFINEPRGGLNKSKGKNQNHRDTMREEKSKLEPKPKTPCKLKNKRQRLLDYNHEDNYNETDDDDDDPDYYPSSIHRNTPKPMLQKTKHNQWPKTKKSNKTSVANSVCGFLELEENSFSNGDEYAAAQKQSSSKTKPIKKTFALRKAQTPTISAISMSKKTYIITDKCNDAFADKPKEVSFNQTVEAISADEMFDKLIIDESTPRSHVSESPDSTTAADLPRTTCEQPNSASTSAAQQSVTVSDFPPSYAICCSNANGATKTLCSQSDEDIFAQSEKQQPKPFPKFSTENGYEVITLSSDSEDDATSTVRSITQDIRCLPINSNQIKVEKEDSKLRNTHTSMEEQPKKSLLTCRSTMANTANPRNKTSLLRSILKHTPQVSHSNGQASRSDQTPKLVKYPNLQKEMKDVATQITPPRAGIKNKIRPQMKDKASEANLDDETNTESSSLDSPCFIPKPCPAMREAFSVQQQKNKAVHHFDKAIIGRAMQFQRTQVVTPKLCSVQTQTDSSIVRVNRNSTSFHFLPSPPVHRPMNNSETPRKRYVSWKEDRVINLLEENVAKPYGNKEKQLVLATKRESEHDRFLYSVKLEMELGNDGNTFGAKEDSNWQVSSPDSKASVQEIPLEVLAKNGIQNAAEDDLENAWCNMFNSPIRSHVGLNVGGSKSNKVALLDLNNKTDASLNLNAAKNIYHKNKINEQSTFTPSNNTSVPAMVFLEKDNPTSNIRVNSNIGDTMSLENAGSALSLHDSEESTEVTCSSTSSDEIISTYEENRGAFSVSSSLTNSPLNFRELNGKFGTEGVTSTPALAPTVLPNPEPSLLESLLEKMRRFGPNSGTNEMPDKSLLTPKGPPFWPNKVLSVPTQKKLQAANPHIMIQDSAIMSSKHILASPIPKSPTTPKNAYEALLPTDCSIETPAQLKGLDLKTEICDKTEQPKKHYEEITARKDNLLCDLFDAATPKSAGGTLNRFLGYSHQFQPRSVCDEDCSDEFG